MSLLFSGIIYGWPSFSMLLQQDGAFLDERRDAECRRHVHHYYPPNVSGTPTLGLYQPRALRCPSTAPKAPAVAVCGAGGACRAPPHQRP
eukprot:scaffold24080_cov48-Phaeocystis_antarctica.AAC.1